MKRLAAALLFLLACGDDAASSDASISDAPSPDGPGLDAAADARLVDAGTDSASDAGGCAVHSECDDGDPCTNDMCSANVCTVAPESLCCVADTDCVDTDPCTNNERCVDGGCQRDEAVGCEDCIDRDRDGHFWDACGGDDCDDENWQSYPGAPPACLSRLGTDANCDGVFDANEDVCGPTSASCDDALALPLGTEVTILTGSEGACGDDVGEFFRIDLAEKSDLRVTVRVLYDEDADPDRLPDYYYDAYLRDDCETTGSRFPGWSCGGWSPMAVFYPGSPSQTYDAAHVPAGSHILELRGAVVFRVDSPVLGMAVTVEATPAVAPECASGAPLDSSLVTGTTGTVDAFRFTCAHLLSPTPVFVAGPEAVHPLRVTERERWRVTARGEFGAPRLAIHATCDPALQPMQCVSSRSGCEERTIDAILDPGDYFLVVDGIAAGGYNYELAVHREAPGASCAGARVVTSSGRVRGDTTDAGDNFRSSDACGDGSGPDGVLRIDVERAGYFGADFVFPGTFTNALIAIRAECGGEAIRQHNTGVSWSVEPGTYYLTIDGADADNFGPYQIDITMP